MSRVVLKAPRARAGIDGIGYAHLGVTGSDMYAGLRSNTLCHAMKNELGLDKYPSFITSQLKSAAGALLPAANNATKLAVTISRQTGSGAHAVGERLAEYLQAHASKERAPWTLFDRNLAEQVLSDHNLPPRLARFMPEDRTSPVADAMEELLGAHPPAWKLLEQTAATILRLAGEGNVILIGRGANLITRELGHVFHVRLVGSLEKRTAHIQEILGLGKAAALDFIQKEDAGRQRYLRKHFGKDLDDPMLYHMVINTDLISYEETARIIGETVLRSGPGQGPAPEPRFAI